MSAFDLRPLRVAIDLESVLASTHPYFIKGSHNRGVDSHDNVIELYRIPTAIENIIEKYTANKNINPSQ